MENMAGGLAVISDVPEDDGVPAEPLRKLATTRDPQATLDKATFPELRPDQKDTDSLPPYDVLDAILEDYVEYSKAPEQIAAERGFDLSLVRRVVRMVDGAEYKPTARPLPD